MSVSKLDHVYLAVRNLNRAVNFYQKFLGLKVKNRFEDRWTDFDDGKGFYLGLYNPSYDGGKAKYGPNVTVAFRTENIEEEIRELRV